MTLEARGDKEESLGKICLCIWLPAMKQFCHDFPIRLLAGKASLNILMVVLVQRGKKKKHQFCGSWDFSTDVLSDYILNALLYIIKKFKREQVYLGAHQSVSKIWSNKHQRKKDSKTKHWPQQPASLFWRFVGMKEVWKIILRFTREL